MKEKEKQIIEHYGVIPQLKYMQTEMFEFIEAVIEREIHWNFDTEIQDIKPLDKHIEEEYADLTMMLEQFKEYYHLDENNIQKIKEQKIERQLERIKVSELDKLQQENKKLNGTIQTYDILLKANVEENKRLKDNWNYIKRMLKEARQEEFNIRGYCGTCTDVDIDFLLNKMQELEQGSDSDE